MSFIETLQGYRLWQFPGEEQQWEVWAGRPGVEERNRVNWGFRNSESTIWGEAGLRVNGEAVDKPKRSKHRGSLRKQVKSGQQQLRWHWSRAAPNTYMETRTTNRQNSWSETQRCCSYLSRVRSRKGAGESGTALNTALINDVVQLRTTGGNNEADEQVWQGGEWRRGKRLWHNAMDVTLLWFSEWINEVCVWFQLILHHTSPL